MKIKLIAIDMDGTLLDDKLNLSERNKDKLNELLANGVYVVFATGRTYRAAKHYAKELIKDIPLITYNGALIKMSLSEKVVMSVPIPLEKAYKIISLGEKHDVYIKVYIDDKLYVEQETMEAIKFSSEHRISYQVIDKLKDNIAKQPFMIVFKDSIEKITKVREELEYQRDNTLSFTLSTPYSLEFSAPNISKANSLINLCNEMGITMNEVLSIGNSLNDLDMLKVSGIGIAMKNSDDELKRNWSNISQYTNNEDGVAKIIDDYQKNKTHR